MPRKQNGSNIRLGTFGGWAFECEFEAWSVFPTATNPGPLTLEQAHIEFDKECRADYEQINDEAERDRIYELFEE